MTHAHAAALHLEVSGWVTLGCVVLLAGYLLVLRRYGPIFAPNQRPATTRQVVAFGAGVVVLWLALGSPLHALGERTLLSAHLLQHLLLGLLVPPLLLLGLPRWLAELAVHPPVVRRALAVVTRPWLSVGLFSLLLIVLHLPVSIAAFATGGLVHSAAHALLLATGFAVWLPLVSPVPAVVPRPSAGMRALTLFALSLVPTVPASALTLMQRSPYLVYDGAAQALGVSPLHDLWAAGLLAKVGGSVALWTAAIVLFFRWAAESDRRARHLAAVLPAGTAASPPDPSHP